MAVAALNVRLGKIRRHRSSLGVLAIVVPSVLYIAFVYHYAVNVPRSVDDWSVVRLVELAHGGHLRPSTLWTQYGDRRLVAGRAVMILFGFFDHLDLRAVTLLSALLFAATFAVVVRRARLGPGRVVALGIVWFSLIDYGDALWAFQLSWYLALFAFVATMALLERTGWRWFGAAVVAACVASVSDVQGLAVWPLGLVPILLGHARKRAWVWAGAAVTVLAVYFHGYSFANTQCVPRAHCTVGYELSHPILTVKYLLALIGDTFPTASSWGLEGLPSGGLAIGLHEGLGLLILAAGAYVVVKAWRQRQLVPLELIGFGLLFDLSITAGRSGSGIVSASLASDYAMPNLLVLVGIVLYVFTHLPGRRFLVGALGVLISVQALVGTAYGIRGAETRHNAYLLDARVLVASASSPGWICDVSAVVWLPARPGLVAQRFQPMRRQAIDDHLSLFAQPSIVKAYRREAMPSLTRVDFAHLPWTAPCT